MDVDVDESRKTPSDPKRINGGRNRKWKILSSHLPAMTKIYLQWRIDDVVGDGTGMKGVDHTKWKNRRSVSFVKTEIIHNDGKVRTQSSLRPILSVHKERKDNWRRHNFVVCLYSSSSMNRRWVVGGVSGNHAVERWRSLRGRGRSRSSVQCRSCSHSWTHPNRPVGETSSVEWVHRGLLSHSHPIFRVP